MNLMTKDKIFDTIVDTTKLYVSMKTYFTFRKYKHKPGLGYVYLFVTGNKRRERINIDLEIAICDWDNNKNRLIENSKVNQDKNLILENYISKVTEIKTQFRLSDKQITPSLLRNELLNGLVRVNFVAFFKSALQEDKVNLESGTFERYESVYKKLAAYREEIIFTDLEVKFFNSTYRTYLSDVKGNGKVTINSNMIVIKKYLIKAVKYGVKIKFDPNEVLGGSTKGNRTYLTPLEIKELLKYYQSDFINSTYKIILGYFLFDCMTGLRISDLMKIERKELINKSISFVNKKSKADQHLSLNKKAQWICEQCEDLFIIKFSEKHMNEEIKKIMRACNIEKKVSFHVGRHTFATCFLRAGGTVHHLQKLLKHKNINDTMIYVHILESEANQHIFLLDNLFD